MKPATPWNIFSRELDKVLAAHGLRIGLLDNRYDAEGFQLVHPAKVSRLQKSLTRPPTLTTLNPEELEKLAKAFGFTPPEQDCLRMAVMAVAVERMVMERLNTPKDTPLERRNNQQAAYMAADDVFRILLAALSSHPAMTSIKGNGWSTDEESEGDDLFEQALALIDHGSLAMHACKEATNKQEQLLAASEARATYKQALAYLIESADPTHDSPAWVAWHEEATQQMANAAKVIQRLEGERP